MRLLPHILAGLVALLVVTVPPDLGLYTVPAWWPLLAAGVAVLAMLASAAWADRRRA